MITTLLVLGWIVCSLTVAGWMNAYFPTRTREDLGFHLALGMIYGVLGPIGVLFGWLVTGFACGGWSLKAS